MYKDCTILKDLKYLLAEGDSQLIADWLEGGGCLGSAAVEQAHLRVKVRCRI